MASFEIRWRHSTRKDLRALPREEVLRVLTAANALADEPFPPGSQKLSGSEHSYRIRLGDYRVVYGVLNEARVIEVQRVAHRRDVYR